LLIDFCLIFVPFGLYDEPEILHYENTSVCPKGADVRHVTLQKRLAEIVLNTGVEPDPDYLEIITQDLQETGIPDIGTEVGQRALDQHLDGVELVIMDNLSTLHRSGKDNDVESWQPMQQYSLELRRRGISVLYIHHANKGGNQRGTSAREDILDTVITLKQPSDYQAEDGLRVEVVFEKCRGLTGSDVESFEAKMEIHNEGAMWTTKDIKDDRIQSVAQLTNQGMTQRDIADDLGIGLATVNRAVKEAQERGLINGEAA